jgi:hypothetical protein
MLSVPNTSQWKVISLDEQCITGQNEKCLISGAKRGTHTSLRNLTHFTPPHHLDCNFYLAYLVHLIPEEPVMQTTYFRTLWEHAVLQIYHSEPRHQ